MMNKLSTPLWLPYTSIIPCLYKHFFLDKHLTIMSQNIQGKKIIQSRVANIKDMFQKLPFQDGYLKPVSFIF